MGFFSWKTSDTGRSVSNAYSNRGTFPVWVVSKCGKVLYEDNYDGYGVFGGKDIFDFIAELNPQLEIPEGVEPRQAIIDLIYETDLSNGKVTYKQSHSLREGDFRSWQDPIEAAGGKTANQLMEEGFKQVYPRGYGDFGICAESGLSMPKIFEYEPDYEAPDWLNKFNKIQYPEDCEGQGYWYDDDEDEDDY